MWVKTGLKGSLAAQLARLERQKSTGGSAGIQLTKKGAGSGVVCGVERVHAGAGRAATQSGWMHESGQRCNGGWTHDQRGSDATAAGRTIDGAAMRRRLDARSTGQRRDDGGECWRRRGKRRRLPSRGDAGRAPICRGRAAGSTG